MRIGGTTSAPWRTPPEAEREIERKRPDLVLCDLVLPGSSGMELLKRMKRQDEQLPVVMMTAHGNVDGAVEGSTYVSK